MKGIKYVARGADLYAVAKMKVKVTRKDILEGSPGDSDSCPIALAVQRTVNKTAGCNPFITVRGSNIDVGNFYRIENSDKKLDKKLNKFVCDFDSTEHAKDEFKARKKLKPFAFDLIVENRIGPAADLCA